MCTLPSGRLFTTLPLPDRHQVLLCGVGTKDRLVAYLLANLNEFGLFESSVLLEATERDNSGCPVRNRRRSKE